MTPEQEAECWRLIHEMEATVAELRTAFRIVQEQMGPLGRSVDRLDMRTREVCHGIEAQIPLLDQLSACIKDRKPKMP